MPYFNHRLYVAASPWQRRQFLGTWWRLSRRDARWTPPRYTHLRQALHPASGGFPAAQNPVCIHLEALYRRARPGDGAAGQLALGGIQPERPLAAAVLLRDPRRRDGAATLAGLQCVNDAPSLEMLLAFALERAAERGAYRLLAPCGLSPHLETGALTDRWNLFPPAGTPYNPPYLPELLAGCLQPLATRRLYHLAVPPASADPPPASGERPPVSVTPLAPNWLAGDGLPWLQQATATPHFPPPDAAEARFMLAWLGQDTLDGWVAHVGGVPAGFILLQPDLGPRLRLWRGGRPWWGRLGLWLTRGMPAAQGRAPFMAVGPPAADLAGMVAERLWRAALETARRRGWRRLTIGPWWTPPAGGVSLFPPGAEAGQIYRLYEGTV